MSPPQSINHYKIVSKLGEGGMGAVYRATDTKLNRDVAIKVLPEAFAHDEARMARFEREAQVLASLNHPNIATIYGIEQGAIVMELVEGEDLHGPLPVDTAIGYARQIAAGLEAAHEKGVVHRDLKPANVKVTPEGAVKILDFGLAKAAEAGGSSMATSPTMSPTLSLAMTQAGMILGTAAYMSPEQARGKIADKRADIWSFGVVLYEMITGRRPFEGEDASQTMAAVIMQEPNFDGIPATLHRLLRSCLEKDPKKRLHDIADVWHLMKEDIPAPEPAVPPAAKALPLATSILATLAFAAAGGLAFVHFREQPPTTPVTRFNVQFSNETVYSSAISPDGRQIVAATNISGQGNHLMLRSLDTLECRALPGTDFATQPFWSPDSRYIGFESGNKLKIIDLHGGPPQTLAEVPAFRGASWSSSGTIVYSSSGATVRQIRSSGGTPANVPTGSLTAYFPAFLPDGRHFLFTAANIDTGKAGIYLGSVDSRDEESRQPRRILPDVSRVVAVPSPNPGGAADQLALLFVRDTTLMGVGFHATALRTSGDVYPIAERIRREISTASEKFSASNTGNLIYETQNTAGRKLTWYDRQGKVLGTVDEPGSYRSVALSPDGTQLAADRESGGNIDIWLYDLVRNSKIRLTSNPEPDHNPVWSPDGKWIAFNSMRDNTPGLYRKAANGTGAEELLLHDSVLHVYDWSPDGKQLLVASTPTPGGMRDLYLVPVVEGEHKLIPLVESKFRDDQGRFSPDGRFVAYKSNETGRDEIYVQPAAPGAKTERWVVSQEGGTMPRWSRDGKELFFFASSKLMVTPVQTSPTFHAGLPKELFTSQIAGKGGNAFVAWDLTPDAKRFIIISDESGPQEPLTVVLNWPAGLRK